MEQDGKPSGGMTDEGWRLAASMLREQMDALETAFGNSGNPLYVWKAINLCRFAQAACSQGASALQVGELGLIPPWCVAYLFDCANAVGRLALGLQPHPAPNVIPADISQVEVLPARKRLDALPMALGFARPGWNAFVEREAIKRIGWDIRHYDELREGGIPTRDAISEVMDRSGVADERSVRRSFAKHRRLFTAAGKPQSMPAKGAKPGP